MIYIDYSAREVINKLFAVDLAFCQDISYGFNWIRISPTDKTRLAGIAVNKNLKTFPPTTRAYAEMGTFLKPGKFLAALFPERDQNEISRMAAKLQKYMTKDSGDYKLLKISDIPSEVYKINHKCSGDLGSSCMRHLDQEYFEIYDDSPTTKILYLKKEGELQARALLHEEVETEDLGTIKFMDRIYTSNENQQAIFFKWAAVNGYYRKEYQNYSSKKDVVSPEGASKYLTMSIKVHSDSYKRVPFMDTLPYYCRHSGRLSNADSHSEDELCGTDGYSNDGILSESYHQCYYCENYINNDNTYIENVGYVCESCLEDYYVFCEECEDYINTDLIHWATVDGIEQSICEYCLDQYYYCDICGTYTSGSTEEFRKDRHSSSLTACSSCIDDEGGVECEECVTFYPNLLKKCPTCENQERERILRARLPAAVQRFIDKAGFGVKNERLTWMTKDNLYSLRNGNVLVSEIKTYDQGWQIYLYGRGDGYAKVLFGELRKWRAERKPKKCHTFDPSRTTCQYLGHFTPKPPNLLSGFRADDESPIYDICGVNCSNYA